MIAAPIAVRERAIVERLGTDQALVSFPGWCRGQVLVPVAVRVLVEATGLDAAELAGVTVTAVIRPEARTDVELQPQGWQLHPEEIRRRRLGGLRP